MALQLGIIFGTRLVSGNFIEICVPAIMQLRKFRNEVKHAREMKEKEMDEAGQLEEGAHCSTSLIEAAVTDAELDYNLKDYGTSGLFDDYSEMMVLYGYATLFVATLPISPFLALVNNYAEIRIDAYKLLRQARRPDPQGAEDIGTWLVRISFNPTHLVQFDLFPLLPRRWY
jgi:hypothetical protein